MESTTGHIDLQNRTFTFGTSDEQALCYRNPLAFMNSSEDICYIPENGVGEAGCLDSATTYTYADFEKLIADFLGKNFVTQASNIHKVLEWEQRLFDCCQWQDPSTIIDEWMRSIDDEADEIATIEDMQEYVNNFDWSKDTKLLKEVYDLLP